MQIDRLLETLLTLLKYKKTTAKELANRFNVSVRTIYRDVDTLTLAGVPIYCIKGNNGGIFIDENYLLDRNYLTNNEKEQMEIALQLLQAMNITSETTILDKLYSIQESTDDWLSIDFNDYDKKNNIEHDILLLKKAILEHRELQFTYYSKYGQVTLKTIQPVKIIYRQNTWILLGYCNDNEEYQHYLLSHIKHLKLLPTSFTIHRPVILPKIDAITVRLKFSKRISYKIYDDFLDKDIHKNIDGSYEIEFELIDNDSLYAYLLSFGSNVEIISPLWLKKNIVHKLHNFLKSNQI